MIILLVQLVMTAATLCYAVGYAMRRRNNALHRRLMLSGFVLTFSIALVLVAGVHLFGASYGPASWLVSLTGGADKARAVLIAHRVFATVTFVLLAAQVYTGIRRLPLHRRLQRAVIPTWLISYISGLFIFT